MSRRLALGRRQVRTLIAETLPAGSHRVAWDARNRSGVLVSAGTYFARLESMGAAAGRKIVIQR